MKPVTPTTLRPWRWLERRGLLGWSAVYVSGAGVGERVSLPTGLRWEVLDHQTSEDLFAQDSERVGEFREFHRRGHFGMAIVDETGWVSYGWLATAEPPSHIPRRAAGLRWIFYCRTKESHRGRGYYPAMLSRLRDEAGRREVDGADRVYVDTSVSNVAARRGIERAGFRPAGRLLTMRLPKTDRVWSVWMRRLPRRHAR